MWVVYVPREDAKLKQLADAWIPIRDEKGVAKKVGADTSTHSTIDRKYRVTVVQFPNAIPDASSLTNKDVVYVMGGHCVANSENVTWPDNHKNPIAYSVVADRLVSAGLRNDFAGEIKVYSCQSGVGDEAFGKRFANYMRGTKGFGCAVWAYTGNISTNYINTAMANYEKPPERPDQREEEKREVRKKLLEKTQAKTVIEELRDGGIHKFMQLQVARPFTERAKESKRPM